MKSLRRILVPLALTLPLTASTCTKTKDVDVVVGVPTEIELSIDSTGGSNYHEDTNAVDLRDDLDLASALDDAGIDRSEVSAIHVVQVFYRITAPQAGKMLTNGHLTVERGDIAGGFVPSGSEVVVADGYTADLGTTSPDWIDVTDSIRPGINVLDALAGDLLNELKTGTPAQHTAVRYHVSGNVEPGDTETHVGWSLRILIQATATREFEIPFG
jgi:hypothetical protein